MFFFAFPIGSSYKPCIPFEENAVPPLDTDSALQGEIFPRQDIPQEQLRNLGEALRRWFTRESQPDGCLHDYDHKSLALLLAGELPAPVALRHLETIQRICKLKGILPRTEEERKHASEAWNSTAGRTSGDRTEMDKLMARRFLWFHARVLDPARVAENLRRAVPAELIERVQIGGVDWNHL